MILVALIKGFQNHIGFAIIRAYGEQQHFDRELDKRPPGPRASTQSDGWAAASRRSYPGGRIFYKDDAVAYFNRWRKLTSSQLSTFGHEPVSCL